MTPTRTSTRATLRSLTTAIVVLAASSAVLLGCGSDGGDGEGSRGDSRGADSSETTSTRASTDATPEALPQLKLAKVDVELSSPIAAIPGTTDDSMIVAERGGTVRVVTLSTPGDDGSGGEEDGAISADASAPVIDISSETSSDAERGLLGVALSPDSKRIFISYTSAGDGTSHLDAFDVKSSGADQGGKLEVDEDSRVKLLSVTQPFPNHNGGNITFGPDGMLYLGLGDGGAAGDPYGNAQNRSSLLGKILRLNPDATGPDDLAAEGNPGFGPTGRGAETWLTGVRNPWRFSFDSKTGDLWIGDVGQDTWEEVDLLTNASGLGKGANLGWDLFEGTEEFGDSDPAPGAASEGPFVEPVYTYRHGPGCSITGGVVYRGTAIPALVGTYLFSDYCDGTIRGLQTNGPAEADSKFTAIDLGVKSSQVVDFATDAAGETYVLSLDSGLFKLVDADTVGG